MGENRVWRGRPSLGQRAFLCRWLLVGRLAFGQLGARVAAPDAPRTAWVQVVPEQQGDWHPLEMVGGDNVLTLDQCGRREDGAWPNCCPN